MKKLLLATTLAAAVVWVLPSAANAQPPNIRGTVVIPSVQAQGINRNPYIAPGLTLGQYAYNLSVLGNAYSRIPPYALGYNPYPPVYYGPVYPAYPVPTGYALPYAGLYGSPYAYVPGSYSP